MKALLYGAIVLLVCSADPVVAGLRIIDARWRPDANPFIRQQVWDGPIWSEGWQEEDQFYPKHFRPAGSLHVILANNASESQTLKLTHVDGEPIAKVLTTPRQARRVVWQWIEPQTISPGGWTECVVRLRTVPTKDVKLSFETDSGGIFDVVVPAKPPKIRIESVSFSPAIDRIYVYLRSLDGSNFKAGTLRADRREMESCIWTASPVASGLMLVEAPLNPKWDYGSRHLIEVDVPGFGTQAISVRAWDCYFSIGLFGPADRESVVDAKTHGFNTYYWNSEPVLDELGLNYIPYGLAGRPRTLQRTGALFYYNMDEPDAHDVSKASESVPYMDRLGINASLEVIPRIREQREKDPTTLNMLLVDNTYKPLNWYVYGQIADVFATDPYVPLGGEQIERVPYSLATAHDAAAPRPLVAVIWATAGTNHKWGRRFPTVEEERMMAFYALGCGAKGIGYFADYEQNGEGEGLRAVSDNKPLWEEIGKINADIRVLAPYLSIGCPIAWSGDTNRAWVRAIMCGRDHIVAIAVNKMHHIGFNTSTEFAWHFPVKNVTMSIPLPQHFANCRVQEVVNGTLVTASGKIEKGKLQLSLDKLDTARAFVITRLYR